MTCFRFRLIVQGHTSEEVSNDELLDATDLLGEASCDDATVSVYAEGLELEFDRVGDSLQEAIASAVQNVESAGFRGDSIRMDRESVFPL